jgi:hypothetical protein
MNFNELSRRDWLIMKAGIRSLGPHFKAQLKIAESVLIRLMNKADWKRCDLFAPIDQNNLVQKQESQDKGWQIDALTKLSEAGIITTVKDHGQKIYHIADIEQATKIITDTQNNGPMLGELLWPRKRENEPEILNKSTASPQPIPNTSDSDINTIAPEDRERIKNLVAEYVGQDVNTYKVIRPVTIAKEVLKEEVPNTILIQFVAKCLRKLGFQKKKITGKAPEFKVMHAYVRGKPPVVKPKLVYPPKTDEKSIVKLAPTLEVIVNKLVATNNYKLIYKNKWNLHVVATLLADGMAGVTGESPNAWREACLLCVSKWDAAALTPINYTTLEQEIRNCRKNAEDASQKLVEEPVKTKHQTQPVSYQLRDDSINIAAALDSVKNLLDGVDFILADKLYETILRKPAWKISNGQARWVAGLAIAQGFSLYRDLSTRTRIFYRKNHKLTSTEIDATRKSNSIKSRKEVLDQALLLLIDGQPHFRKELFHGNEDGSWQLWVINFLRTNKIVKREGEQAKTTYTGVISKLEAITDPISIECLSNKKNPLNRPRPTVPPPSAPIVNQPIPVVNLSPPSVSAIEFEKPEEEPDIRDLINEMYIVLENHTGHIRDILQTNRTLKAKIATLEAQLKT